VISNEEEEWISLYRWGWSVWPEAPIYFSSSCFYSTSEKYDFYATYTTRIMLMIGQVEGVYTSCETKIIKVFKTFSAIYEQIF
jgi:hypothetical protein